MCQYIVVNRTILADIEPWRQWQNQSSANHSPAGVDCVLGRRLPPVWTSCVQRPVVTWLLVRFLRTVVTWPVSTTRGGALKARPRWRPTSIWPDKHHVNHRQ